MNKILTGIALLLVNASTYAMEVKDAPPPESANWLGIVIFLVIMIGASVWFFRNLSKGDDADASAEKSDKK